MEEERRSIGLEDGFRFDYTHMTGEAGVSAADLERLRPAMLRAAQAVEEIVATGTSRGHLSKDGAPEPVYFARQAYLREGNPNTEESLARLEAMGDAWQNNVDAAVFIGIGGSYLGEKLMFELATHPYWNQLPGDERQGRPQIYFAGNNVDGDSLYGLVAMLELQSRALGRPLRVQLVPMSKSGTTMEPLTAFTALWEHLHQHPLEFEVDVTVVTELSESSLLYRMAEKQGWEKLEIPVGIGGRFCVLSNPGLLMGAVLGYDIRSLLAGAREMAERCLKGSLEENPALLNAALKYLAAEKLGAPIEVFMGYGDKLKILGEWYVQLLAESLGKRQRRDGKNIFYGRTPVVALGTTDMHSMTQQHQDGARDKVLQFVEVERPAAQVRVPNPFPEEPGFDRYAGRNMDTLLKAALNANEQALAGDGRLSARYILPELSPRHVGQLLMFLMFSIAYEGELADVDAYDQPGVESYKRIMKKELEG